MSKPPTPPNPMQISLTILGEIEINDNVHGLDVDTASEEIGADEVAADALAEVVEDTVAVGLEHFGVGVETGVAEFGYFFGEEFDAVG